MQSAGEFFQSWIARIPDISVVVPVYRSEASLPALAAAVDKALNAAKLSYELILVNDGSPDRSWLVIKQLATRYPTIVGLLPSAELWAGQRHPDRHPQCQRPARRHHG